MNELSVEHLLSLNLSPHWQRINADLLQGLRHDFDRWQVNTKQLEDIAKHNWQGIQLAQFLLHQVNLWLNEIDAQNLLFEQFSQKYHKAANQEEARHYLGEIAASLAYSRAAQVKIRRGHAPWLDDNAIFDGHIKKLTNKEQDVSNTLQRLGDILSYLLRQADGDSVQPIWLLLSLHLKLEPALHYPGNIHIRIQAFACLSKALTTLATLEQPIDPRVPANVVQYIYRCCLDEGLNIWLRCEAIQLVSQFDPKQFFVVIDNLFVNQPAKDMYLRGRIAQLVCQFQPDQHQVTQMTRVMSLIAADTSDYVRQQLVKHAIKLKPTEGFKLLKECLANDHCAQVRAQVYLTLAQLGKTDSRLLGHVQRLQLQGLSHEQNEFTLRTLLHTLPGCAAQSANPAYRQQWLQQIDRRQQALGSTALKRWLASTREYLWAVQHALLPAQVQQQLAQLALHETMSFKVPVDCNKEDLERYLASIGRERFGFDIQHKGNKFRVRAGFKFGFRFWRFWHELRTPATDKRENHNHLKGRLYFGLTQTASQRMAEMSATKVPGEPLYIEAEQDWRGYLPLLDQVLSSLDQGWPTQAVKIYSSEGITAIMPPKGLLARLWARMVIQFRFAQLAQLRNWQEKDSHGVGQYVQQLTKLGFTVSIMGYLDEQGQRVKVEPKVQRFFPALALPFALPSAGDIQNYFYSVYQNTLSQLLVFTGLATFGYLGIHVTKLRQMRNARNKIPLVIGGWGTRGKSGTERLKAAMFNAMGLTVVSKTTGCEAMFLFGPANRPMKEMFLFRPYDKASIWEQVFLTRLTAKLGADVFLWECMGLTPRYIDIIQNQWMRDDISTITNCYPDHEDLQGPAGIEIPIVMQLFVPKNSVLIASEESMLPLLEDAARSKKTHLVPTGWLESGLLTDDVVKRFPYQEHPNNIALVAQMAKQLGIAEDFALKEMADNVIADLGVLMIYPVAEIQQRRLIFINGMSANERLGAISNWQRTGLADQDRITQPDKWLAIVVNNRSDRVARSKVFATMLVQETQADCYFFIGNNLTGFTSYILEAWHSYTANLALSTAQQLSEQAQKFRIATSEQQVLARLQACISGLSFDHPQLRRAVPQGITVQCLQSWQAFVTEYIQTQAQPEQQVLRLLAHQFEQDANQYLEFEAFNQHFDANRQTAMQAWLLRCFQSRWVIVEDYYASGNQTVNTIIEHSPPGLLCNIIGVQNIKGTGLDFIYRWQSWQQVHQHCEVLSTSRDPSSLADAAKALTTWQEFGLLDQQKVCQTLDRVKNRSIAQTEHIQSQLGQIQQGLAQQLAVLERALYAPKSRSRLWALALNGLEAFLDAGDAIKRRKKADKIYQAVLDNLISYDKASVELAKITQAQKGGWLKAKMQRLFEHSR